MADPHTPIHDALKSHFLGSELEPKEDAEGYGKWLLLSATDVESIQLKGVPTLRSAVGLGGQWDCSIDAVRAAVFALPRRTPDHGTQLWGSSLRLYRISTQKHGDESCGTNATYVAFGKARPGESVAQCYRIGKQPIKPSGIMALAELAVIDDRVVVTATRYGRTVRQHRSRPPDVDELSDSESEGDSGAGGARDGSSSSSSSSSRGRSTAWTAEHVEAARHQRRRELNGRFAVNEARDGESVSLGGDAASAVERLQAVVRRLQQEVSKLQGTVEQQQDDYDRSEEGALLIMEEEQEAHNEEIADIRQAHCDEVARLLARVEGLEGSTGGRALQVAGAQQRQEGAAQQRQEGAAQNTTSF